MVLQGKNYENLLLPWHEIWQHVYLRYRKMGLLVLKHICHAYRLIPLDKLPGVRPIATGEVIRRIIGKAVTAAAKSQIAQCVGQQQLCAGQRNGCQAAVHAMTQAFDQEGTDAILLVEAENAFNSTNRKVLLHNIQYYRCGYKTKTICKKKLLDYSRIFIHLHHPLVDNFKYQSVVMQNPR